MAKFTEVLSRMIEEYGLEAALQSIDEILAQDELVDTTTVEYLKECMIEDMSYAD
jgi:hypothetical protein